MKKILISLLAMMASCACLTACFASNAGTSTPDASTPSTSNPTTSDESAEPVHPHVEALELAKDYLYGQLVEKDIEVRADYKLMGSYNSFFFDAPLTVTWAVDVAEGVTLKLDEEKNEWTVDVDEFLKEDLFYKLTATIADNDGHSTSFTLDRKVLKEAPVVPEKITEAPVEGKAYKLYMYQVTKKAELYFTGEMSGFYLATTNASQGQTYVDGVDVYVENVEGKEGSFYIYFTDAKGVKQYFGISNSHNEKGWHVNAIYSPTNTVAEGEIGTFEFTYSTKYGTFIGTVDGITYEKTVDGVETVVTETASFYFGTYSGYYTIGTSHVDNYTNEDASIAYLVEMIDKTQVDASDKVASEKKTLNITTAFSGAVEEALPTQGTTFGDVSISWAVKSGDATIENNVLKVAAPTEEKKIVLTATITCGEASDTADVEISVYPKSPVTAVAEPVEGTAYAFYLYQANKAKNYYFTGKMDGNFLATTDDATKAADVYAEKSGDGVKIYVLNADNSKSYIKLTEYAKDNGKYGAGISLDATDGSVFIYNAQFAMWSCNTGNDTFYLGTYNEYTTISASATSYVNTENANVTQFIARFGTIDESAIVPPSEGGEEEGGETPTYSTPEEILNALYALDDGESLEGEFTLTGEIIALDNYNNPTIVVTGFENKPVYCYKLKVTNVIGDTITVTATSMKNYGGTYEFMNCTLVNSEVGGGEEGGEETLTTSEIGTILTSAAGKYQAEGTVVATYARGFVLKDKTGMILVYLNALPTVNAGDKVTVVGTTSNYGKVMQFGAGSEVTYVEAGSVGMALAESLTAEQCDAYVAAESVSLKYVELTGTLSVSGNYYNITIEGATTAVGSVAYPTDEMKAQLAELDGKVISVEGYFIGVSGTKYVNIMATSVKEAGDIGDDKEEEKPSEEECKHNYVDGTCTECGEADPDYKPEELTQEDIVNAAYALESGAALEGSYTLTGTIVSIDTAYSTQYSNITVTIIIDDMANNLIECFRMKGEGADTVKVGDVICVTGTLKNYNGKIEFDCPSLDAITTDATASDLTKAVAEARALDVVAKVEENSDITLPLQGTTYTDVVISYASDNACAVVNGGTIAFTLPEEACNVTITATLTCNEATFTATFGIAVSAAPKAGEATYDYALQSATAGTQYADESKVLDDNVTISTHNTGCHFHANNLRIYHSTQRDGYAVITSKKVISAFSMAIADKSGPVDVYGSTDGTNWTLIQTVTTSNNTTSTLDIDETVGYTYLKIDPTSGQLRINSISLTLIG